MKKNPSPHAENNAKAARRGNPDKLIPHRWQRGQSGNPGGRQKKTPLADACREVLGQPVRDDAEGRTYAQAIAATLAAKALEGDIRAAQELGDRADGRARQAIEIDHTRMREAFDRMSEAELDTYAREGKLPAWFPQQEERSNETVQ